MKRIETLYLPMSKTNELQQKNPQVFHEHLFIFYFFLSIETFHSDRKIEFSDQKSESIVSNIFK